MPHLAHREGVNDGVHRILQGGAGLHHGGDDLGGQGGQNVGLDAAAQAVGEDEDVGILRVDDFDLVAAELLAVLIEGFPRNVYVHHHTRPSPLLMIMFFRCVSVALVSAVVSPRSEAISCAAIICLSMTFWAMFMVSTRSW